MKRLYDWLSRQLERCGVYLPKDLTEWAKSHDTKAP